MGRQAGKAAKHQAASEGRRAALAYHLCPRCGRATPATVGERHCPNDGTAMLQACPGCGAPITSPHGRYCWSCGRALDP